MRPLFTQCGHANFIQCLQIICCFNLAREFIFECCYICHNLLFSIKVYADQAFLLHQGDARYDPAGPYTNAQG